MHRAHFKNGHGEDPYVLPMNAKEMLVIPPYCVHQLKNTQSDTALILAFACPPSHLTTDRIMVDDLCSKT
jgi:mannose-6-phosphate isomerase-like protein (cupin superfamily)